MTNDVGDGFKAVADFWTAQSKAVLDGMQAMFGGGTTNPVASLAVPPDLAQAGESMMQLWSMAAQFSSELAGRLGQHDGGVAANSMLERITNPRQWMMGNGEIDEALAKMVDGPRLADLWDIERRYGSVMRRWTELRQRSFEHQRVVLEAWMEAGRSYMTEAAGQTLDPKQAMALWTEVCNRHMLEAQRSDPFLVSQRDMIRASTELRIAQGELSEFIGKQYGLPTRTEVDDVHRTLTEMRRELRKIRRELDAAQHAKPAASLPAEKLVSKAHATVTRPAASRREAR